ncbi:MAG: hypothetical protein ACE5D6_05895, partial [Candidatus Zixiibacteriota bacterium]
FDNIRLRLVSLDTSAYQGAAGSLDSTAVYGAVIEAIVDTGAGVIDDSLSGTHGSGSWGGSGTGAYSVDIYAIDTSGTDDSLMGVALTIQTITGSFHLGPQSTNSNGYCTFNLDADSFRVLAIRPDYMFGVDTIVITANDTVSSLGYDIPLPAAATTPGYVSAYMDIGTGFVDSASGNWVARDQIIMKLNLIGAQYLSCGNLLLVPKEQEKTPDANGRVTFRTIANAGCSPLDSYYELSFETRDRRSKMSGVIKTFVLDTLTNPINIINATEVR